MPDRGINNYKREVIRLNNAVNFYKKIASQTQDEEDLQEEILYLSGVIVEQQEYIATLEKMVKAND